MQRSNLCYKYEYIRPNELFGKPIQELTERERKVMDKKMLGEWVDFHSKYIDHERYMRRQRYRRHERRAVFFRERHKRRMSVYKKLLARVPDKHADLFARPDADDEELSATLTEPNVEEFNRRIDRLLASEHTPPLFEHIDAANVSSSTDGNDTDEGNNTSQEILAHEDLPQINTEDEDQEDSENPAMVWGEEGNESDDDILVIDEITVIDTLHEIEKENTNYNIEELKDGITEVGTQQTDGRFQRFNLSSESISGTMIGQTPASDIDTQTDDLYADVGIPNDLGAVIEVTTSSNLIASWPGSQSSQQRSYETYNEFEVSGMVTSTQDTAEIPPN